MFFSAEMGWQPEKYDFIYVYMDKNRTTNTTGSPKIFILPYNDIHEDKGEQQANLFNK